MIEMRLQKRSRYSEGDRVKIIKFGHDFETDFGVIFSVDRSEIHPSAHPYGVTHDTGRQWYYSDAQIEGRLEAFIVNEVSND